MEVRISGDCYEVMAFPSLLVPVRSDENITQNEL